MRIRIRIQQLKLMRIHADPDPKPCAAGPLRTGAPGRCAAAVVPSLGRALLSAGAVNTFLSPRDRRENRKGVHAPPQGSPDIGGYRASQAAAQGLPRCAGATCPRAATDTAGAAATGDLQPSTDNATNDIIIISSIRPPASQRLAAEPTQPLSLPPQTLGGPGVAYHLFLLRFLP
jgi:hypothetical protein